MARKLSAPTLVEFTASQEQRRSLVEDGRTVLANIRHDKALIAWAEAEGLYVRIDRRSEWGNPYEIGEDGDRKAVIDSFKVYISRKLGLQKRVAELRGKVLGCWCHPDSCHGDTLIKLAEESPVEHDAP